MLFKIKKIKKWLNDPKGVSFTEQSLLIISKILLMMIRNSFRLFFGKTNRDNFFKKKSLNYISILNKFQNSPILVKNEHGKFYCRTSDQDLILISEKHENFLKEKLYDKKFNVVFDLGAHIGKYAIGWGSILDDDSKIIAVEADPKTYEFLCKNIEINNFQKKIFPIQAAISDKIGNVDFYTSEGKSNVNSMKDMWNQKIKVTATTIDEIIKNFNLKTVDLIQMDIQGAEYEAIKGAMQSIRHGIIKKFVIETHGEENFQLITDLLKPFFSIEEFHRNNKNFGYLICKSQ